LIALEKWGQIINLNSFEGGIGYEKGQDSNS
jgi:hypothetical protein